MDLHKIQNKKRFCIFQTYNYRTRLSNMENNKIKKSLIKEKSGKRRRRRRNQKKNRCFLQECGKN